MADSEYINNPIGGSIMHSAKYVINLVFVDNTIDEPKVLYFSHWSHAKQMYDKYRSREDIIKCSFSKIENQ